MNLQRDHDPGGLTSQALLALWDLDVCTKNGLLAIEILVAADPNSAVESLQKLPVGERDARLLAVRRHTMGPEITGMAHCPECGEAVETSLDSSTFESARAEACEEATPRTVQVCGREVVLRALTAGDLMDAEDLHEPEKVRSLLLQKAVLSIDGEAGAAIDDQLADRIEEVLEQIDPMAVLELNMQCPGCSHTWSLPFDPVRFLREEIRTRASRLLSEVAELAQTYHWSEAEILAMSDARRQHYLEMAGS